MPSTNRACYASMYAQFALAAAEEDFATRGCL